MKGSEIAEGGLAPAFRARDLAGADFDEVLSLWGRTDGVALGPSDNRATFEAFLGRNPGLSLVVENGGRLIGTLLVGHDGRRGYLYHLAVEVEFRGHGVGRWLVREAIRRLDGQGIRVCHLFVLPTNATGQAFWSRIGFKLRDDLLVYTWKP